MFTGVVTTVPPLSRLVVAPVVRWRLKGGVVLLMNGGFSDIAAVSLPPVINNLKSPIVCMTFVPSENISLVASGVPAK